MKRQHLAIAVLIAVSAIAGSVVSNRLMIPQRALAQAFSAVDDGAKQQWEYRVVQVADSDAERTVNDLASQRFALFKFRSIQPYSLTSFIRSITSSSDVLYLRKMIR